MATAYEKVVGSKPVVTGEKYWTYASIFTDANVRTIVFGPGNDECYWVDEYIETDQLLNATKIYASLMLDLGSKDRNELRAGTKTK